MARARNIKPSFFRDAKIVSVCSEARLLFVGMWCIADYKGRFKYEPLELKMEIFPADNVDIDTLVSDLERSGLIEIYRDHNGSDPAQAYVLVKGFEKHQNPHKNEKVDRAGNALPCCPDPSSNAEKSSTCDNIENVREHSASDPADSLNLIPDSLNLIPDSPSSDSRAGANKSPTVAADYLNHLIEAHCYDEISTKTRMQNISQAKQWLSDEITLGELDQAVEASRARLLANDDNRDPPVTYVAKVLSSNRQKTEPVKAGKAAINTHSGFTPERYAVDDVARKFKVVGGDL